MLRQACSICGDNRLVDVIDLGLHPCADTFLPKDYVVAGGPDQVWPLIVCECSSCKHVQTKFEVAQDVRYRDHEYSFVSSHSANYKRYWDDFAAKRVVSGDRVLEIGCNDGYLLEACMKLGCTVFGVDPSPNMVSIAAARGIAVTCAYFEQIGLSMAPNSVDVVIANNVLNHIDDLSSCMLAVKHVLASKGRFVVQVPSWGWMVRNDALDQIYHEHVHYFTESSLRKLGTLHGLQLVSVELAKFHGESLVATFTTSSTPTIVTDQSLDYQRAFVAMENKRRSTVHLVEGAVSLGKTVLALGASAKGNTFLNYARLTNKQISYVLDVSDLKIGKYTPLSRIPIVHEEMISEIKHPVILTTTWNLPKTVLDNLRRLNSRVTILGDDHGE